MKWRLPPHWRVADKRQEFLEIRWQVPGLSAKRTLARNGLGGDQGIKGEQVRLLSAMLPSPGNIMVFKLKQKDLDR
jgi:hypothetical protein